MPPENKSRVAIVDYSVRYGDAFARLNIEWLDKYFEVEPIDRQVLSDPERTIIAPGGVILYACVGTEVVGTVAIRHYGNGVYELTKMAVTESRQGLGIGRQLLCAVVDRFHQLEGKTLYLESHSDLVPAVKLYESAGFRHESPPSPSDYARANVFMVYRPAATPSA